MKGEKKTITTKFGELESKGMSQPNLAEMTRPNPRSLPELLAVLF